MIPLPTGGIPVATKFFDEAMTLTFDFSQFPEVAAGATLSSPTVTNTAPDNSLVLGTPAIVGNTITTLASGGVTGTEYLLKCDVHLSSPSGTIRTLYMKLLMLDPTVL